MIKLVVGLGNPGPEYELNRHNIGWLTIDNFQDLHTASWKNKFKGIYVDPTVNGEKVYFLKPQTYYNVAGESVQALMHFFKITPDELLVVHDDLDLEFGQLQVRKGGGLAGNNGLKSITQSLGTQEFGRLRVGIGRPKHGSVSSWVLSNFPIEQNTELEIVLTKAAEALDCCLKHGLQKASNQFNRKNFLKIDK